MITYQDFLKVNDTDKDRMDFCYRVISIHKSSDLYRNALIADDYDRQMNTTIRNFQKLLYTVTGKAVPDTFSANYKLTSNFFHRFVIQQNQFLLGNGISWNNDDTEQKLGGDFDVKLQIGGHNALVGGVSFGYWNFDHVEFFKVTEFAPIFDEENGALRMGVRFWQIDPSKPLRATFYEEDGYTEYIWHEGKGEVLQEKRTYQVIVRSSKMDGTEILDFKNYPTFPIVPLWANRQHQSELVGIREQIDAYDLIKSAFCNTIDEASYVYWTLQNAGGMDDVDLAQFVERMKTLHASVMDDGVKAEAQNIEAPHEGREALLNRLRKDLYEDFMALDTKEIASGAVTATQIMASYEPMNAKADGYEYCIHEFVMAILDLAGIDDEPTFTRSMMVNATEEIQTVLSASAYLSDEYVTRKILTILGDADKADEVLEKIDADELDRVGE